MKNFTGVRHGDISFHPIDKDEKTEILNNTGDKKKLKRKNYDEFVVAEGEVTGHRHMLTVEKQKDLFVTVLRDGQLMIELTAPGTLSHEEHDTLTLEPGIYLTENEREFDPFGETYRKVLD